MGDSAARILLSQLVGCDFVVSKTPKHSFLKSYKVDAYLRHVVEMAVVALGATIVAEVEESLVLRDCASSYMSGAEMAKESLQELRKNIKEEHLKLIPNTKNS